MRQVRVRHMNRPSLMPALNRGEQRRPSVCYDGACGPGVASMMACCAVYGALQNNTCNLTFFFYF